MMRLFMLIMMFLACSCTTLREVEKERVTVKADTIVRTDTVETRVIIPGETRVTYLDRIDTVFLPGFIQKVQAGRFCLDTLRVRSSHAAAWFGVRNNVPFLGITQQPIELIVQSYIQRITMLEKELREREKVTVKRYLFYENPWFWAWAATIAVIVFLVAVPGKRKV